MIRAAMVAPLLLALTACSGPVERAKQAYDIAAREPAYDPAIKCEAARNVERAAIEAHDAAGYERWSRIAYTDCLPR